MKGYSIRVQIHINQPVLNFQFLLPFYGFFVWHGYPFSIFFCFPTLLIGFQLFLPFGQLGKEWWNFLWLTKQNIEALENYRHHTQDQISVGKECDSLQCSRNEWHMETGMVQVGWKHMSM
jgi:hypothetical protein